MSKMIYTICENGHKIKYTGSITKKSQRGNSRENRTPEISKTCPRCVGRIVDIVEVG